MKSGLSIERLRDVLSYHPVTGVFVWRVRLGTRGPVGARAGWQQHGRRYINVDGGRYLASRLAWFFTHGRWPIHEIDHENLDKGDDRLVNLRCATRAQNGANRAPRPGVLAKGVDRAGGRFRAQLTFNRKTRYLGTFDTVAQASAAYASAARNAFGPFARVA